MVTSIQNSVCRIATLFLLIFNLALTQAISVPFDAPDWQMINADVLEFEGQQVLIGTATLNNIEFQDGIIEVDIYTTGSRSYPGVTFRVQDMRNYERFYIRPHRAGLYPDALQYVPVFNGIAGWQLYNGEGYTSAAAIADSQWVHFKFEISGKQMKVYWGESETPALIVNDLKHGISKGGIGLFGPKDRSAYFANFTYRITSDLKFTESPAEIAFPGVLHDWEISQAFKINQLDFEKHYLKQDLPDLKWQKVKPEINGLLDIAKYHGMTSQVGSAILMRTTISADEEKMMNLQFGYSDAVSLFLNGKQLFFGNSSYRQRDPSFLGIIGYHDAVYLPLIKGDNELLMIVGESFGGWGVMARDGNAEFVSPALTKKWALNKQLQFPEAIVYDSKRECLYVSNYFNDGREFISKISLKGEVVELKWVEGLRRPTGLTIHNDVLYSVDRGGLNIINIDSARIVNRIPIQGAGFLNDVAVSEAGDIYVSDNAANKIFRIESGIARTWLADQRITQPNGLLMVEDHLIIGTSGDGCIKKVNLDHKKIKTIACLGSGAIMDGIQKEDDGNYLISDFNGRLYRIGDNGKQTVLLNRMTPKKYCADFLLVNDKNLIIIPSLWDNRITAYEITK